MHTTNNQQASARAIAMDPWTAISISNLPWTSRCIHIACRSVHIAARRRAAVFISHGEARHHDRNRPAASHRNSSSMLDVHSVDTSALRSVHVVHIDRSTTMRTSRIAARIPQSFSMYKHRPPRLDLRSLSTPRRLWRISFRALLTSLIVCPRLAAVHTCSHIRLKLQLLRHPTEPRIAFQAHATYCCLRCCCSRNVVTSALILYRDSECNSECLKEIESLIAIRPRPPSGAQNTRPVELPRRLCGPTRVDLLLRAASTFYSVSFAANFSSWPQHLAQDAWHTPTRCELWCRKLALQSRSALGCTFV